MKCLSCGLEFDENIHGECPTCHLEVVSIPVSDDNAAFNRQLEKEKAFADLYRNEYILKSVTVGVVVGSEAVDSEMKIILFDAAKFEIGKTIWYPEAFLYPKREIIVQLEVVNADGKNVHEIAMNCPDWQFDFCKFGIVMNEGLSVRLLLGMEQKYIISDPVYLIA